MSPSRLTNILTHGESKFVFAAWTFHSFLTQRKTKIGHAGIKCNPAKAKSFAPMLSDIGRLFFSEPSLVGTNFFVHFVSAQLVASTFDELFGINFEPTMFKERARGQTRLSEKS
jgi:hypothetical protein